MARLDVSESTQKRLHLLSGNRCANPDCHCELASPDGRENVGENAHIHALSDGGPRAIENLSGAARNHFDNLILLCCNCHTKIDQNQDVYPVSLLRQWKKNHAEKVEKAMADGFAKVAFADLDTAANRIIELADEREIITGDFEKRLIKLGEKIQKNNLSRGSKTIINGSLLTVKTVDRFIQEHVRDDSGKNSFPNRIKSGILMVYHRHQCNGLLDDDLFQCMLYDLKGGLSSSQQCAVTALVVYYMERCDLFSE